MSLDVWIAAAITTVVFAAGMVLRFGGEPELPPRPARPAATADIEAFRALDYSENLFRAQIERDAALLGVPADPLTRVFPRHAEEPRHALSAGGPPLETRDLVLSLRTARINRVENLVLRIENRTDGHLAYRVLATPPLDARGCMDKGVLPHNAIALAPREATERTECGRGGVSTLTIDLVETIELPALAYHRVSQLHPIHIGLDARASQGHRPPHGDVCADIPEQAIRRGMENRQASWRDVIDFYGRHTCRSFIFFVGYQAFTKDGEKALPVKPGAP